MSKYIDADSLRAEIEKTYKSEIQPWLSSISAKSAIYDWVLPLIDVLQQEQPNKYETALEKAREWMPNVNQGGHSILIDIFPELGEGLDPRYGGRKQEQPEVDLVTEYDEQFDSDPVYGKLANRNAGIAIARHFYELGKNARKEE